MKKNSVFSLALLFCAFVQGTWAQNDYWGISAGTETDPFLIENSNDWANLEWRVRSGDDFSGKVFRMTQDIEINQNLMIGTESNPFNGIFDGDGHTLTLNMGTSTQPVTTPCAPFLYVSGATIRHLTTAGTIYTNAQFAGGIVSRISGSASTHLSDCHSTITLSSAVDGDGTHGGLVAVVSENTGHLYIENCSFTGKMVNTGDNVTLSCGGFVGFARTPVTVTNGIFAPTNSGLYGSELSGQLNNGVNFVRMSPENMRAGNLITLTDCYTTFHMSMSNDFPQGTFLLDKIEMGQYCTYEFIGEPDFIIHGKKYYKSGCQVQLTAPQDATFDHWEDANGNSYISDPWRRDGIHQLKDVNDVPLIQIETSAIPAAVTERTLWGVTYRYLSRRDYHYFISDDDLNTMGWTFRENNPDNSGYANSNLIMKDSNGKESLITAITGYDESNYNSDGVQIHNDLVSDFRDHTHLGLIAPRAFKDSKSLTSLYFKDTDANIYNALTTFKFIIDAGAFEGCTNFQEMKMMQYTTRGSNHWEALTPDQVVSVADDAFTDCPDLKISAHNQQYQNYMSSETWRAHRSRFIIYEATVSDFTVEGVSYHYYRKPDETGSLKNNDEGKTEMMNQIHTWNADYQQFSAADLLETNSGNVYYCYVTGVDNDKLDEKNGVMRIYNDPGSTYNYKNIALGRTAIAGNTHVKTIEFWQTNGNGENSYSDLKMVIPNGALQGCTNLKELRLFYYVEDGDDHWESLGPKDVIPGDNIFGEPTTTEMEAMTEEQVIAANVNFDKDFKIIVAPDRYQEFLDDPNWLPYLAYIYPDEFSPAAKSDFTRNGMTYAYMASPGGILQTSQVVSQDVSWWTVPRIAVEVALMLASMGTVNQAEATSTAAGAYLEDEIASAQAQAVEKLALVNTAEAANNEWMTILAQLTKVRSGFNVSTELALQFAEDLPEYTLIKNGLLEAMSQQYINTLVEYGIIDKASGQLVNGALASLITNSSRRDVAIVLSAFKEGLKGLSPQFESALNDAIFQCKAYLQEVARLTARRTALIKQAYNQLALEKATKTAITTCTSTLLAYNCWDGNGSYNADALNKGMRANILSNIHQVGLVGGGYVITTPQKNIVYHTYIKSVSNDVNDAVIYAGFDNDWNVNTSNRTMTFARDAFKDKTNLRTVSFHDISNQSSNTGMPLLFTIPDEAFSGCTNLTEFSTLLLTNNNGTRALGPENFILAGDNIFMGLDPETFHIVIDPTRKQDFLDNESWAPLEKYFTYRSAEPAAKYNEYGAKYAYAYEMGSIKKEHKEHGHLIEHTVVVGADDDFLRDHQGAVKLCNDIGIYNNYQLDEVMPEAFKDNLLLRSVSFTDLKGSIFTGDVYTGLQMHIGDRAFEGCSNLADIAMLYMVTDGLNHIDPITPQMVTIGKDVFIGTDARIKMMPQQVRWFEADEDWAAYKDRFQPCIIKASDEGVKEALKDMAFYDPAKTGIDQATWDDYIDYARIAGKGFDWLNGRFNAQKDKLRSFADFMYFESVGLDYVGASWFKDCWLLSNIMLPATIKTIHENAFNGCTSLTEIEIPQSVTKIDTYAFFNCDNLNSIVVRSNTPATLGNTPFDPHEGLRIYVPTEKVAAYKDAWSPYRPYIVGMDTYNTNKVVTTTAVGQLAQKLGLTVTKESGKVRYLNGPFAKYDSLTVSGPLNGEDLAVIRHLAGADAYDSDPTDGQLRYLNLWNAVIKKDTENSYNGNFDDEYIDYDNKVGDYLFENCAMIETVILPQSATFIGENTFEDASALKRICVGRNTTGYDTDLLQNLKGIDELVFLTESIASNNSIWSDPWEAPIMQVYALPSQVGDYLGDTKLMRQAFSITSPLSSDDVMWALADAGHFFPSEYYQMESAESIFNVYDEKLAITDLTDFRLFQNVKRLENTFAGLNYLETITLPSSIEQIDAEAFSSCTNLQTIHVSSVQVIEGENEDDDAEFILPTLAEDAFVDLPDGFQILVPKNLCKLYRERWAQYADHINPDDASDNLDDEIITVTVTEPNTLAQALGLTTTLKSYGAYGSSAVNSLKGDYSKLRRLKVIGPISGGDLDVLRHLAGYCPWATSRNYSGMLKYIDLYDAQIKETEVGVAGYMRTSSTFYLGEEFRLNHVRDNILPEQAFLRAFNLKTLILPKTCTEVSERALQECEGLETLVLGDDMVNFNWSALDDDAMLTRMYILAKNKVNISSELPIWRWMCNNYNPTFDAFYVRPSLYNDYINDEAYTGSSWQRTNNISEGAFVEDESFCAFASHAAATADDLFGVTSVNNWFDSHTGVKDLTPLAFTSVSELRADDMQQLTQLERITIPMTLTTIGDNAFSQSPDLRYVDMLMANDELTADIKAHGVTAIGIDSLKTLVYLPEAYGEAKGTNIVVKNGTELQAETFRLIDDKDYCVPYTFQTGSVVNSRKLAGKDKAYTAYLPYPLTLNTNEAKVYKPADREGSIITFEQVASGTMEAFKPYVIRPAAKKAALDSSEGCTIEASSAALINSGNEWALPGYTMRGTLERIDNNDASETGMMMLVDEEWTEVPANNENAFIAPFRAYMLESGNGGVRSLIMKFIDDDSTNVIDTIRTIDTDGTEHYYDLNGRELPGCPEKGIFIHNGKKSIM